MDIKRTIRDRRKPGFFTIDNEVYDLGLSCEAIALYAAIARFANNETESAYFSGKKWKRHHKVGHAKLASAMRELLSHDLIRDTGSKTKVGAAYIELCNIDHLKVFQGRTGGCSEAEQGGVSPQNTNNTNKTKQENETGGGGKMLILPQSKPVKSGSAKGKSGSIDYTSIEPVLEILRRTDKRPENSISKNTKRLIENAIETYGEQFICDAVAGRVEQAQKQGKPLYLSSFFDPENAEWRADCAKLAAKPIQLKKSTLPDFGGEILYPELKSNV